MKISLRSKGIVLFALAFWSLAIVSIFSEVTQWPYLGAEFSPNIEASSVEVTQVRANSPAENAGLEVGNSIVAISYGDGQRYEMSGLEAIMSRGEIRSYEILNRTVEAKKTLWKILNSGPLVFETTAGKQLNLIPESTRKISTLPVPVFSYAIQTLIIFMIGAGIFAFAPMSKPVGLLIASATGMGCLLLLNMLVSSSEISMPDAVYRINYTFGPPSIVLFVYALLALLWYFPAPISRFPFGPVVLAFALFVVSAQYFQYFQFPLHPYTSPFLLALIIGVLIGIVSWRRTRNNPLQRASVMWFVLSIVGVSGFITIFYALPVYFNFPPIINTSVTLFAFTFVFLGIALGTLKYRLFDIHHIWWRTITWMVGGLVVMLVDILLIAQFDFEQSTALPMALLIAGWGYFPIRQFVFEHFIGSKDTQISDFVPALIKRFSGIDSAEEFDGRFAAFMRDMFGAQEIGPVGRQGIKHTVFEDNGLALRIPDVSGRGSFLLIGKSGGRKLFSTKDKTVADSFVRLVRYMSEASQREFEKLQTNREQIVRDLHDDVGGQLLSMVMNAPNEQVSNDARNALAALKESLIVIEDTQTVDASVAWQRLKEEANIRLHEAGFDFQPTEQFECDRIMTAREYMNFRRMVQEITSNIIKYGEKGRISFSCAVDDEGTVNFRSENQIAHLVTDTHSSNRGLLNIRTRLKEVGGSLKIDTGSVVEKKPYIMEICLPLREQ